MESVYTHSQFMPLNTVFKTEYINEHFLMFQLSSCNTQALLKQNRKRLSGWNVNNRHIIVKHLLKINYSITNLSVPNCLISLGHIIFAPVAQTRLYET